ncbi:hypothetical protein NSP_17180 [Nodularia spumigena CCY9414]|nr:hypothetical protein NSP_17180 [Nodularia spumigena CCY9414]
MKHETQQMPWVVLSLNPYYQKWLKYCKQLSNSASSPDTDFVVAWRISIKTYA